MSLVVLRPSVYMRPGGTKEYVEQRQKQANHQGVEQFILCSVFPNYHISLDPLVHISTCRYDARWDCQCPCLVLKYPCTLKVSTLFGRLLFDDAACGASFPNPKLQPYSDKVIFTTILPFLVDSFSTYSNSSVTRGSLSSTIL